DGPAACPPKHPPQPQWPAIRRQNDRRRGAVADVTGGDLALVDRFLDMLASEAGASRHTLSAYRSDLTAAAAIMPSLGEATMEQLGELAPAWAELSAATL